MMPSERLSQIKAISFDGDMTLWDFEKVMRYSLGHALQELRKRRPCQATEELTVDKMIEIRNSVATELKGKVVNLEEIRFHAFKCTIEYVGGNDDGLAAELNALYLKHRFEDIGLYADVLPTLDALSPRYLLGLLSNGNGYPERCGLPDRFAFVVFSQDVGFEKPDKRIFQAACSKAGCRPEELMHVGDSLESDVQGAKGIEALSVWLNRNGKRRQVGIEPDLEIWSLAELTAILS